MSTSHHALIVEDTDEIADIMRMTLDSIGIQSHHVNNGITAVEYLAEHVPDILLLDIGLPGMSGWEVLETIKTRYPEARFPVIVLTAFGDPANRLIGRFQKHVVRYFVKPFEVRELADAVREALGMA